MTGTIELETDDFTTAARIVYDQVAEPCRVAVTDLVGSLCGSGSMAGSDDGGRAWAAQYDRAAHLALSAGQDAGNGCYRLSALFGQTARNYEAADAASDARTRHRLAAQTARLPCDSSIIVDTHPPTAGGGTGSTPQYWYLISAFIHVVWPDGHQDRLRSTAAAWRRAADAIQGAAGEIGWAGVPAAADRLIESSDIAAVVNGMQSHLTALAGVYNSLADSCEQLAHHIDAMHSQVEGDLRDLAVQTGIIEGVGALAAIISFGTAELPTQAVEGERVASVVTDVLNLIKDFVDAAKAVAAGLASAVRSADEVGGALIGLQNVGIVRASIASVSVLPAGIKVREFIAATRLAELARGLPDVTIPLSQLEKKFEHAAALGVMAKRGKTGFREFRAAIQNFVKDPETVRISATRGRYEKDPAILNYNPRTRIVVIQHPNGEFWSAWRMRERQYYYVRKYGHLGGQAPR